MAKTGTTTQGLRAAIERSGYYPALVAEAVEAAVGGEPVASYLVHQETTFDSNEVRRHVTVLVLTEHRFIVSHTDEQAADTSSPTPYATTRLTTTEEIRSSFTDSVEVVAYGVGELVSAACSSVWLTMKRCSVRTRTVT